MKIKKIDLGFLKVEHKVKKPKTKPKFIQIQHKKEPYKPTPESNINIDVVPKSMQNLAKKEEKVKPKLHKPKKFSKLIEEINQLFNNVVVFNALIIAMILFLSFYIILMIFFRISPLYSIIAPIIYLSVLSYLKIKENKYLAVEKKFPELDEKLRTAVDNIYFENPVVDELRSEVQNEMKKVDYASFFKERATSYKILLIILLCFGVIFLSKYDINYKVDFERVFGFIEGDSGGNETGLFSDIILATSKGSDDDIFGEESLAKLGRDEITINIEQVGYEINMDDIRDPTEQNFETSLFPPDIGLESAEVNAQNILKEHQELVKNYFRNMAKD